MAKVLTDADRTIIWNVVLRAAERYGGHAQLFGAPLQFDDDNGRVRFHWPDWMQEIREYMTASYGERLAQDMVFEAFNEVMSRDRYEQRLRASKAMPLVALGGKPLWR